MQGLKYMLGTLAWGDLPIYYCQKFDKQAFTNILSLQYFAMYGI